jgi:hypothetical protein
VRQEEGEPMMKMMQKGLCLISLTRITVNGDDPHPHSLWTQGDQIDDDELDYCCLRMICFAAVDEKFLLEYC